MIVPFVFACLVFKSATGVPDSKIGRINDLLDGLELEKWDEEETACRQATEAILNGVKNNTLWATWVWDSMQLPAGTFYGTLYHFGNFDQCLKLPWSSHKGFQTQYCLVDVKLTESNKYDKELIDPYDDAEKYIGAKFQYGRRLSTLFLGVCLPASCKPESVAKISRHIFSLSHLPLKDVMVDPRDCQIAGPVEKPIGYYVFWFIIQVMVVVCILVYFFGYTLDKPDSTVSKIARCFCLTRNFDALTETCKDEIKMIHGIRALTGVYIIVAHFMLMSQSTFVNQMDAEQMVNGKFTKLTLHTDLCVDTFFVMSGLLHFRSLLSSRSFQSFKTLLKRYFRLLLPLYALSIICMSYILPHIGSGPAWPRTVRQHFEPCTESWWGNFLMITNKVDDVALCSVTGWYVLCDFQLTILSTAIFMTYMRNKRTGIILFSLAYVLSVILPAIWNFWQELPGLLWYDFGESLNMETNKVYKSVYKPFYTRASSYLIGVAMGYGMTLYKPEYYRKTISKTMSILGFIIGISLMVLSLEAGAKMFKKEFSVLGTAVIAAFDRSVWSTGICFIITVGEYGILPIITDFLGSRVFVPLSKLSYCVYLYHTVFIYRDIFSFRTPTTFDIFSMINSGLGYVVVTYSVSYLVWLFIEAPVTNLINLLFNFKRRPRIQNGFKKEAIHKALSSEKL